ncbi:MAG TPA: hypothetical protein VHG28_19290 [Longimicrobiaceae bacterium]|nr:hypothetical protein [Longimicrobiaceae bacterium]
MPQFTLRWANRGTSTQDWNVQNLDQFTLPPDYTRHAGVTVNQNRTFNIAVDTAGFRFTAASLTYTAGTNGWTLHSMTPNEWQIAVGGGFVTVRCFLSDSTQTGAEPEDLPYSPQDPQQEVA